MGTLCESIVHSLFEKININIKQLTLKLDSKSIITTPNVVAFMIVCLLRVSSADKQMFQICIQT